MGIPGDDVVVIQNGKKPKDPHVITVNCPDETGLGCDICRIILDFGVYVTKGAYGRFSPNCKGYRDLDLFIQQKNGKKIVDPERQTALCSRLKVEMLHPLRVIIEHRGPDTELLVANLVELSRKGRPRVFYDVTLALKPLGICVFLAETGRYLFSDREWEVYGFPLDENCKVQLSSMVARKQIVDRVRRTLMGW